MFLDIHSKFFIAKSFSLVFLSFSLEAFGSPFLFKQRSASKRQKANFKKLYCGKNDLIDLVRIRLVNFGSLGFLKIVSLVKLSPLKLQKSTNRVMK